MSRSGSSPQPGRRHSQHLICGTPAEIVASEGCRRWLEEHYALN